MEEKKGKGEEQRGGERKGEKKRRKEEWREEEKIVFSNFFGEKDTIQTVSVNAYFLLLL